MGKIKAINFNNGVDLMNSSGKKYLLYAIASFVSLSLVCGCANTANKAPGTQNNNQQQTAVGTATPAPQQGTPIPQQATPTPIPTPTPYKYDTTKPYDANKVTLDNFNKVNTDMKYDEVISILGGPTSVKDLSTSAGTVVKYCTWKTKEGKEFIVTFSNGLVTGKSGEK